MSSFAEWKVGGCEYVCAMCQEHFPHSLDFWEHVGVYHRLLSTKAYLSAFDNPCVKRKEMVCDACGATVAHDFGKLTAHVIKKHRGMTLKYYYDTFVKDKEVADVSVDREGVGQKEADPALKLTEPCTVMEDVVTHKLSEKSVDPEDKTDIDEDDLPLAELLREKKTRKKRKLNLLYEGPIISSDEDEPPAAPVVARRTSKRHRFDIGNPESPKNVLAKRASKRRRLDSCNAERPKNVVVKETKQKMIMKIKAELETVFLPDTGETIVKPEVSWMNGCAFKCLSCGLIGWSRIAIRMHAKKRHNQDRSFKCEEKYTKIYNTDLQCRVCDEKFPKELDKVHHHMKGRHQMHPRDYYEKYVKGGNEDACEMIPDESSSDFISGGTKTGKNRPKQEYTKVTKNGKVLHECPICQKGYMRPGNVTRHLKNAHSQEPNGKEREEFFDSGNESMLSPNRGDDTDASSCDSLKPDGGKGGAGAAEIATACDIVAGAAEVTAACDKVIKKAVGEVELTDIKSSESKKGRPKKILALITPPPNTPSNCAPETRIDPSESNWYDCCTFACSTCHHTTNSKETIRSHCSENHRNSKFSLVSTSEYVCKICTEKVSHEKDSMKEHFLSQHNMRLTVYYQAHEDEDRDAKAKERERKKELTKEKARMRKEADACKSEAERTHRGPKCHMCGKLIQTLEEYGLHVGEVHGIDEEDVVTRTSMMRRMDAQLLWRKLQLDGKDEAKLK